MPSYGGFEQSDNTQAGVDADTYYLIQPDRGLRFTFPHATPPSVMLEAVRYLLAGN